MAVKRFYETFHPDHYDLYIDVDRAARSFSGTSTIHGEIQEETVLVHQKYMTISKVTVDGKEVPFTFGDDFEGIKIEAGKTGEAVIAIDYSAPLTDTMMGIYPSY